MVFGWLYRRCAQTSIEAVEGWLSQPENIEQLTQLTDALVDRQYQRIMGRIGGTMKGVNAQIAAEATGGLDLTRLVRKDGSIDFKTIIGQVVLPRILGGAQVLNTGESSSISESKKPQWWGR